MLVLHATTAMHICHCCAGYQVSVLCNILEILRYREPIANTFKCKCSVLQHARCFDSRPPLYISLKHLHQVCCANLQTLPPQLNSSGLYNTASHSSICTPHVYVQPSLFFLEGPVQGKQQWKRVRRSWANIRKHLHIWDAWQELSSRSTVNTHAHMLISVHLLNKSRGTLASQSANKNVAARKQRRDSVEYLSAGASVRKGRRGEKKTNKRKRKENENTS